MQTNIAHAGDLSIAIYALVKIMRPSEIHFTILLSQLQLNEIQ